MTPADEMAVLAMNRLAEQVTSPLDPARLADLFAVSDLKQVAELDGEVVGFVLAIFSGKPFENQNYRWFKRWFTECAGHFIYIDRVIVSPACRGQGLGRKFYAAVFDAACQSGITKVCAEMDLEPPNHGSLQFHRKLGFTEIGTQTAASGKRLSMQVCEVGTQSETA
jgi:uncharacterized protein